MRWVLFPEGVLPLTALRCPLLSSPGTPQFYSMNRPVQQPQNQQVGGSLPYRRPASVTSQPNGAHNQNQLNGGLHFTQNQGSSFRPPSALVLSGASSPAHFPERYFTLCKRPEQKESEPEGKKGERETDIKTCC